LSKRAETFAHLHARRYRVIAHFGQQATKPYDDLRQIYNEVIDAANSLVTTYQHRELVANLDDARKKGQISIGWGLRDEDPIPRRLDEIVAAIEAICRQAIQETVKN
jgi:hypothetical protein